MDYIVTRNGKTPSAYLLEIFAQKYLGIVQQSVNFNWGQCDEGLVLGTNFPDLTEAFLNSFGVLEFKAFGR